MARITNAEFRAYVLAARQRLLAEQASLLREVRALYREAGELLARDIRDVVGGRVLADMRARLRDVIRAQSRELSSRVLRLTVRGIHVGSSISVEPYAQIAGALASTAGVVDSLAVEAGFLRLAERQAAAVTARVGKDGLRLSDRVWRLDAVTRAELERLVQGAVAAGWDPRRLAEEVQRFLQPGARSPQRLAMQHKLGVSRNLPYAAMRLARSELGHAYHESSIAAIRATPGVELVDWNLSPAHRIRDVCDVVAARSPYPVDAVPPLQHPQDMCFITPRLPDREEAVNRLIRWVRDPSSDPALERWWQNLRPLLGAGPRPVIRLTTPGGTTATIATGPGGRLADVARTLTPDEVWRALTAEVDDLMRQAAAAEGVGYHVTGWTADGPVAGPTMDHSFGFTHLRPGGAPAVIAGEVVSNVVALLRGDAPPGPVRTAALRGLRTLLHEASHQLRNYGGVSIGDLAILRRWGAGFVAEEGSTDLLAVLRLPDFAARLGVGLPSRPWSYASPAYRPFARFVAGLAGLAGKTRGAELVAWVHDWRTGPPLGWFEAVARGILESRGLGGDEVLVRELAARIERAADGIRQAWAVGPQFTEAHMREEMRALGAWVRARARPRSRRRVSVR